MKITTVGGVIQPGEDIMEIVPLGDTLIIEARIRPADIAYLRPDQKAIIKVSAYDFSIYGGLSAQLARISADTIRDRSEEHTSELQSLMRISYAVFCLKKNKNK